MYKLNKTILYLLLTTIVFGSITTISANTQNNTISEDALISSYAPDTNYLGFTQIKSVDDTTLGGYIQKELFRANFSGIPNNSTINHVDFVYTLPSSQTYCTSSICTVYFRAILSSWNENTVTWNTQPTYNTTSFTNFNVLNGYNNAPTKIDITDYSVYNYNLNKNLDWEADISPHPTTEGNFWVGYSKYAGQYINNTLTPYISINYTPPIPSIINITSQNNNITNNNSLDVIITQGDIVRFNITTNLIIDSSTISCGSGNLIGNSTINSTNYYIDCRYNTVGTTYANISVTNISTSTSDYRNWIVTVNEVSTSTPNILRGIHSINVTSNPFIWYNNLSHDTILIINDGVITDISFSLDNITYYTSNVNSGYFYILNGEYVSVSYKEKHSTPTITMMG